MIAREWVLIKDTVSGFIKHENFTRGAAIAYYTIFSIAPLLIIVIAIASLVFGHDAAEGAIVGQLSGLVGKQSGEILQSMIQSATRQMTGIFAMIIGVGTLLLTATGVPLAARGADYRGNCRGFPAAYEAEHRQT
jgi:membrane protein